MVRGKTSQVILAFLLLLIFWKPVLAEEPSPEASPQPTSSPEASPQPTASPQASPQPTASPQASPQPTASPSVTPKEISGNIEQTKGAEHPAHEELRLLQQHMEDAMNARDIDSLLEGVADDAVFSTINGDVVRGRDKLKAYFDKMLGAPNPRVKSVKTHFKVDELTILYSSEDNPRQATFGVAYGHSDDEYTLADGTVLQLQPRWSAALVREEQSWKVANLHYSVNVFENPVLTKLKHTMLLIAGGLLLLGLFLGYFIGRQRKKR